MREIKRPLVTRIRWASSDPWLVQYPTRQISNGSRRIESLRFYTWQRAYEFAVSMAGLYPCEVAA